MRSPSALTHVVVEAHGCHAVFRWIPVVRAAHDIGRHAGVGELVRQDGCREPGGWGQVQRGAGPAAAAGCWPTLQPGDAAGGTRFTPPFSPIGNPPAAPATRQAATASSRAPLRIICSNGGDGRVRVGGAAGGGGKHVSARKSTSDRSITRFSADGSVIVRQTSRPATHSASGDGARAAKCATAWHPWNLRLGRKHSSRSRREEAATPAWRQHDRRCRVPTRSRLWSLLPRSPTLPRRCTGAKVPRGVTCGVRKTQPRAV